MITANEARDLTLNSREKLYKENAEQLAKERKQKEEHERLVGEREAEDYYSKIFPWIKESTERGWSMVRFSISNPLTASLLEKKLSPLGYKVTIEPSDTDKSSYAKVTWDCTPIKPAIQETTSHTTISEPPTEWDWGYLIPISIVLFLVYKLLI
jgi:hypothetical protein